MAEQKTQTVARSEQENLPQQEQETVAPSVDICEDKECVTLYADLPGVSKEGLDVHVDKDTLKIYGKRGGQAEIQDAHYYTEIPERDYYRAFTIGEEIDREKISAQLTNGVLKVVLHKAERAKPRKINIAYS